MVFLHSQKQTIFHWHASIKLNSTETAIVFDFPINRDGVLWIFNKLATDVSGIQNFSREEILKMTTMSHQMALELFWTWKIIKILDCTRRWIELKGRERRDLSWLILLSRLATLLMLPVELSSSATSLEWTLSMILFFLFKFYSQIDSEKLLWLLFWWDSAENAAMWMEVAVQWCSIRYRRALQLTCKSFSPFDAGNLIPHKFSATWKVHHYYSKNMLKTKHM